jgi:hypothetical protein
VFHLLLHEREGNIKTLQEMNLPLCDRKLGTLMETHDDDWIARWGRGGGDEGRLRKALYSKRGRSLVSWFKANELSPDALAFCLVGLAWPIQGVEDRPWSKRVVSKKGASRCRKAVEWLQKYGWIFDLPNVEVVYTRLDEYVKILDRKYTISTEPQQMNPALIKTFWGRSHPARFVVIGFLTAYFILGEDPKYPKDEILVHRKWERIKDVLLLAGLGSRETKAKDLGSLWSNAWQRLHDQVLEQLSLYLKYRYDKRLIYEDKSSDEEDVEEIERQLTKILKERRVYRTR